MEGSTTTGALVPILKSELSNPNPETNAVAPREAMTVVVEVKEEEEEEEDVAAVDKDMLCPICMQIITDAFVTGCGHSFCYMCIITHLRNKSDCPCCSSQLTASNIFPNFLLTKLLKKNSACQIAQSASPVEQFHKALQQGCKVSVKELDGLLSLLAEKKRKMEQEEAETSMRILLDFLQCLRTQKVEELREIQTDLRYIKEDIDAVERHSRELRSRKPRCLIKPRTLDDSTPAKTWSPLIDNNRNVSISGACDAQGWFTLSSSQNMKAGVKSQVGSQGIRISDGYSGPDAQYVSQSGLNVLRKRQVLTQFNDLQECYLQKRRHCAREPHKLAERDTKATSREGYNPGLEDFQSVLTSFTRYSQLKVIAELKHGDLFHSANIVSSIEFDRDDEFFATAGVSRRIKVFEFSSVVSEPEGDHFPAVEMSTRTKLSCLSWNKCTKSHIASSDYEGIVTVWDVSTRQSVMEYEEHEKRAWSVDFSRTDPSMLVSGSDDYKVKVWCTNQEESVINIDMKANICSVKYNPGSSVYLAVGSADRHIYYYDLRNISQPLFVFGGHNKAVSYVKFLTSNELASASTDSTVRLWDVKANLPLRTYRGHTNEKNFVGLTGSSDYVACGSETNEIFVYHKAISKPAAWHKFSPETEEANDETGSCFISAVCWKNDSPTVLAANSRGTIKVLALASG